MITVEQLVSIRNCYKKGAQPTPKALQYLALKAIRDLHGIEHGEIRVLRAATQSIAYLVASGYTQTTSGAIVADWLAMVNTNGNHDSIVASLRGGGIDNE